VFEGLSDGSVVFIGHLLVSPEPHVLLRSLRVDKLIGESLWRLLEAVRDRTEMCIRHVCLRCRIELLFRDGLVCGPHQ